MGIQRQPHPRDVRYIKLITHRLNGLPDDEIADTLGFGSPAALYQRLAQEGYPVCSVCGEGPVDKPHCEVPEESQGPTKPKARSGTKEHRALPPVSNAAELFRRTLAKLAREVEELEHRRETYSGGRFVATNVYEGSLLLPREFVDAETWRELCEQADANPEDDTLWQSGAAIKDPEGGAFRPSAVLAALIGTYLLAEEPLEPLLEALHPDVQDADLEEITKFYRNKHKTNKRPPSDWIGVPVPDSGIPRDVVDAARAAIKNNCPSSNSKRRSWELSGGLLWCGGCGRRMSSTSITPGKGRTKRYFYYRCPSQGEGKACPGPKTVPAEKLEADVWRLVSGLLKDPKTLRRDLDAMIESERVARIEDPEREAESWIRKLAEVDDKRSRYQDMAAEGLITFEELGEKLVVLDDARKTAEHALQALRSKRDRIADLEHDRDALLDSLMQIGAGALEALTPAERNRLYRILQLKVVLRKDRRLEVSGAFGEGLDVCELESQCRVASR